MPPPSQLLLQRWDEAAESGALRTSAANALWRVTPGDLGIVVTFNPLHQVNKRPVASELAAPVPAPVPAAGATHSSSPSASVSFNFTKARRNEFLCGLNATEEVPAEFSVEELGDTTCSGDWEQPRHAVLVNVSPLMRGHLLFVFDLSALCPQSLTFKTLRLAAGIGSFVVHEGFSVGFNSAGAWSSVNHCHFQGFWLDDVAKNAGFASTDGFPVVRQPRELLLQMTVGESPVAVSHLTHWPSRCLVIESADAGSVVRVTWTLIRSLQIQGIPHNLLFTWNAGLVMFVFPRQPQRDNGIGRISSDDGTPYLRFAVAEVAGLVVAGSQAVFSDFTETIYENIMRHEISLDETSFLTLAHSLRGAL